MLELLDRLFTPTTPGALVGSVHPDLGLRMRGSRPTATIIRAVTHPKGVAVVIAVPVPWLATVPALMPGAELSVAIAVDGVRHTGSYRVLAIGRTGEGPVSGPRRSPGQHGVTGSVLVRRRGITLLVPAGADDVGSRRLGEPAMFGQRVWLDGVVTGTGTHMGDRVHLPRADAAGHGSDGRGGEDRGPIGDSGISVRFAVSGVGAPVRSEELLLEIAEAAGLDPTTGCRRGVCHRCSTRLLSGETVNNRDGTVGRAGDSVRICVSTARTDVELEL